MMKKIFHEGFESLKQAMGINDILNFT